MDKDWKRFFWLIVALLVALIFITSIVSIWYSGLPDFWKAFYPQFMATMLGIVITVLLTYWIWLLQQKHTKLEQRRQLLDDLKFEVSENLKWLENLKTFLGDPSRPEYASLDRVLNTTTMKYALSPQNLVLLKDFDLADYIKWTLGNCEEYNENYRNRFRQFLVQNVVAAGEQNGQQRARTVFGVEVGSDVGYIRRMLEELMKKLETETPHTADTQKS